LKHSSSFKYCHSNKSLISACDRSSASLFFSGYLHYYFKSIFATIFIFHGNYISLSQNDYLFSYFFIHVKVKKKTKKQICVGERGKKKKKGTNLEANKKETKQNWKFIFLFVL